MTEEEAREVADLLVTLDDAREWRESFETGTKRGYIGFGEIWSADDIRRDGTSGGWEGDLRMPRQLAIDAMKWIELNVLERLRQLGIEK